MATFRLITIGGGLLLLLYGVYSLHSGSIITIWARMAPRPTLVYWITVVACLMLGVMNLFIGIRSFFVE
jgi:hypothetical protein